MGTMPTLLHRMTQDRAVSREQSRLALRAQLRGALQEMLPGATVIVFGSLTRSGDFNEWSDIDVAVEHEPAAMSVYQLIARLSERLGRRVDVVVLAESRLRDKIRSEGETWTL